MLPDSLDQAKELVYGHPLESFIAERDQLVKQIRAAGDRDLAAHVKSLRKPSAVAAQVNQIVRSDPAGIDLILQAAALLRSAQTGALEGSTIDASQLQQQYRAAIQALSQSAKSRPAQVRAALEAATINESSNDDLRSGCLVVVPTPVSVFGTAPATAPAEPAAGLPVPPEFAAPAPRTAPVDELEQRRAQRRSSKAKQQAEQEKQQAVKDQAAAERASAEAEKQRVAKAEAQRKRDEKERASKLNALKKAHREAVRAHLQELDAEEAASAQIERAEQMLLEIDHEHQALEKAIADLELRRSEAVETHAAANATKADTHARAEKAEAGVEALADAIAAIEDE